MTREEAIKIVKEFVNGTCLHLVDQEALETLIPELELAESEDEMTHKRAIAILKQQRDFWSYDGPMDKFPPATPRKDLVDAIDVALSYLEKQEEQKRYWKPTETDVALFNKAVTTNKALTPTERAQLDIIRSKFGYCRAVNCSGIVQKEQKPEEKTEIPTNEMVNEWMRDNSDDNGFFNQVELARHFYELGRNSKPAEWCYPYGKNETVDQLIGIAECLEQNGDCSFNGYKGSDCGKFLREIARREVENKTVELNIEDEFEACESCYAEEYSNGEYCHEQSFKWGFQEGVDWAINKKVESIKQEWSDEDEKMRWNLINAFTDKNNSKVDEFMQNRASKADVISFFKALGPQPQPKWSEDDQEHADSILERLDGMCKKGATFTQTRFAVSEDEDWIKDLRRRFGYDY